jgi:hypothetical protein
MGVTANEYIEFLFGVVIKNALELVVMGSHNIVSALKSTTLYICCTERS